MKKLYTHTNLFHLRKPERKLLFTPNLNNKKAQRARSCLAWHGPGKETDKMETDWIGELVPKATPRGQSAALLLAPSALVRGHVR